jgi:Flp pilus assembly protein TadD
LSAPNDVRAMLVYSRALIAKQDFVRAGKVLQMATARDPNNAEVHRQLAVLALANRNSAGARSEFLLAWRLEPNSRATLEDLLKTFVAASQSDAAIDLLKHEIQGHPRESLLYHELAQLYLLQKRTKDATDALITAVNLSPNDTASALLLADVYATGNNTDAAAGLIAESLRRNSSDLSVVLRAAMLFSKLQRWEDAGKAYEQALQLDSDNAMAQNNLAWLLAAHGGDANRALKLAQQAKEKLPDDLQVTNTIGWLYYKKGIYQSARNYLKECADKDPTNSTFHYQLGMAYSKLGDRDEARKYLLRALSLHPAASEVQAIRESLSQP